MSGKTTSRFGCLGCAWLGALVLGSVVMVGALLWMEPQWLHRFTGWGGEPALPSEEILIPVVAFDQEDGDESGEARSSESLVELWTDLAREGSYEPAKGLTLRSFEGSEIVFPPGSISGSRPVVVTPVSRVPMEMTDDDVLTIGPLFDVSVDSQEHWAFEKPIRVAIPYKRSLLPDGFPDGEPVIAVWEKDRWKRLATHHDLEAGMLTADVPHASVLGVVFALGRIGLGVAAGWSAYTSEPAQVLIKHMMETTDRSYQTKNFEIHYCSVGANFLGTPPDDLFYRKATTFKGKKDPNHPRYITDVGVFLEEGRRWLPDVGLEVAEPWVDRWDVFVVPLNGSFGESGLGGPVVVDNDMRFGITATKFPDNLEYEMRRTVVHELIHVAQDDHLSNLGIWWYGRKWWMESTAEYLSVWLTTKKMGIKDPKPFYYIKDNMACLAFGWDGGAEKSDKEKFPKKKWITHWYSYARLMDWMAQQGLDVPKALAKIAKAGAFTEKEIDGILRGMSPGLGLADYHAAFARQMYHDNLWKRHVTGDDNVSNVWMLQREREFTALAKRVGRINQVVPYKEMQLREKAVVSKLFPFLAQSLPPERGARLVVQVEAPPGAADTWVLAAGLRGNAPYRGTPTQFEIQRPRPLTTVVSPAPMVSPATATDQIDRMSVVVTHGSFNTGDAPITVRRWLLMAPISIQFLRTNSGKYAVGWPESELKAAGEGKAFKGYHVYRRAYGETAFPDTPINAEPMTDEFFVDTPPSTGFYEYTVRVRDIADNLSEPAPLDEDGDPFVGIWEGKMRLVKGSIAELAKRKLQAELAKAGPDANLGGANAMVTALGQSLAALDMVFRLGIPVKCEVRAQRGAYVFEILEVFGKPVEESEELELDRLGRYTIGKLPTTPQGSPVFLSLTDKGKIIRAFYGDFDDPELGSMRFGLKIAFERLPQQPAVPSS